MAGGSDQCPGQSSMFWRPEDVHENPCPHCGYLIEFFKIDLKRKCPRCHHEVLNPKANFSCAEWCEHAEECLGPAIYTQVTEKRELEKQRKADFDSLLNMIPPEDAEIKDVLVKLYHKNTDPGSLIDVRTLGLLREENPTLAERVMSYYRQFVRL
ncbi:MAG: hypothetical protein ACYC9O_18920 [Candidatus Latescibacterota bacterium]